MKVTGEVLVLDENEPAGGKNEVRFTRPFTGIRVYANRPSRDLRAREALCKHPSECSDTDESVQTGETTTARKLPLSR